MRYLGSKESLTDSIKELLQEHNLLQKNFVFFDAFCGMGSVADYNCFWCMSVLL